MIPSVIHETKTVPKQEKIAKWGLTIYWILSSTSNMNSSEMQRKKVVFEILAFGRFKELFPFIQFAESHWEELQSRYISY